MFGVPARTEFDLNFRLLGMPVRITPFFWVATAFLGSHYNEASMFLLWILAVTISLLVHEFGHALTARYFGAQPEVILYEMGGLCVYGQRDNDRPWRRFVVLALGPGAGFLFAGLVVGGLAVFYKTSPLNVIHADFLLRMGKHAAKFVDNLLFINFFWGLVNLLPVVPLDGGQMASILLTRINSRNGMRWGYVLSLVCGGLVAIVMAQRQAYIAAIMFGLLAFRSYQVLQTMHYQTRYGDSFEQDEDWWKR